MTRKFQASVSKGNDPWDRWKRAQCASERAARLWQVLCHHLSNLPKIARRLTSNFKAQRRFYEKSFRDLLPIRLTAGTRIAAPAVANCLRA